MIRSLCVAMCALALRDPTAPVIAPPVVHPHVWRLLEDRGESVKVWVMFADKGITSAREYQAAIEDLAANYNPRAVQRRRLRRTAPGLFDRRDLPVCPKYVEAVAATGAAVCVTSTWLNAVSAVATREQVHRIAALTFVGGVQPVRRGVRSEVVPVTNLQPATPGREAAGFYGGAQEQLEQIGVTTLHGAGYTGLGVVVGILDTGFQRSHEAFNHPSRPLSVVAEYDFVDDDGNTAIEAGDHPAQHSHGTMILGTLGAYAPSSLVGGAYGASFVLAKTEDVTQEVPGEEDQYVAGLQFIEANGADLATSSLGYIDWYTQSDLNGLTAVTTVAVNIATANGLVCLTAAGNHGHDSDPATSELIAPSDAFEVIACGAVDQWNNLPSFTSDGPSADGRVKPEVVARGVATYTVHPSIDTSYTTADGTSLSTPLAAGAVALLIQAHPDWSVSRIRSALFETADYYVANGTYDPLLVRGYGLIDVAAAYQIASGDFDLDGNVDLVDYASFPGCLSGPQQAFPAGSGCETVDFDFDGDVDLTDLARFSREFDGG